MIDRARSADRRSSAEHLVPDDAETGRGFDGGPSERVEAFVVRTALDAQGDPQRTRIVHVRSRAEAFAAGWRPDTMVSFMEDCLRLPRSSRGSTPPRRGPVVGVRPPVDLDAGVVVGARVPDVVELAIATTGRAAFTYSAVLAARPYPGGEPHEHVWTDLATVHDDAVAGGPLPLRFSDVVVPDGLQRLRVRVTATTLADGVQPWFSLERAPGQR